MAKCQDGFIGQRRLRTDIGSQSESKELAESVDNNDWHVDINIVISIMNSELTYRSSSTYYVHAAHKMQGSKLRKKVAPCRPKSTVINLTQQPALMSVLLTLQ